MPEMTEKEKQEYWAMAGRRLAALAARIPYDYPELYQRILEARKRKAEVQVSEGNEDNKLQTSSKREEENDMSASLSTVETTTQENTKPKKRPVRALKDKDQVIINRQEFAKLWKLSAKAEWDFNHGLARLVEELQEKVTSQPPVCKIMDDLADLLFNAEERNELWVQWEEEFNQEEANQTKQRVEDAMNNLRSLAWYEKAQVQALLDKEVSSFTSTQKSIRNLAGCLDQEASEQVLKLVESLAEQ